MGKESALNFRPIFSAHITTIMATTITGAATKLGISIGMPAVTTIGITMLAATTMAGSTTVVETTIAAPITLVGDGHAPRIASGAAPSYSPSSSCTRRASRFAPRGRLDTVL